MFLIGRLLETIGRNLMLPRVRLLTAIEARPGRLDSMRHLRGSVVGATALRHITEVPLAIHGAYLNGLLLVKICCGKEALVCVRRALFSYVIKRVDPRLLIAVGHLVWILGAKDYFERTWSMLSHRNAIIKGPIL